MPTTSNGIHYEVRGDGPVSLLMLPGLGCSIGAWEGVAPLLDGYRLILMDLPGHAGSIAAEADGSSIATITRPVLDACDEIGLSEYAVVGLSFGSTIGVRIAIERPHQVIAVMAFMPWPASGTKPGDPIMERFLQAYGDLEAINGAVHALALEPSRTTDVIRTMSTGVSEKFWRSWYGAGVYTSMYDELGSITVPVSYVLAGRDAVAPRDQLIEDVQAIPRGRMVYLAEIGHLAPYEDPDIVATEIVDFLGRYTSAQPRPAIAWRSWSATTPDSP